MKTYRIECVSTAESPITHMSGTAGNEAIVAREPVQTPRGVAWVPFLSGNALRHRAVREPGVLWLIEQYGLRGKLSLAQLNFLLHGGNLTESTAHENTRRIAEMHRLWPLLRLCGGTLPNQILAGSLDVWRGILVCEENRQHFPGCDSLLPAAEWLSGYQYTRGDGRKLGIAETSKVFGDDGPSNLMIFSGQSVIRGARFYHGFLAKHASEVELGALLWSLQLWQHAGGTIGGQAARGHGRLRCELLAGDYDQAACVEAYRDYALAQRDEAVAWLRDCWK